MRVVRAHLAVAALVGMFSGTTFAESTIWGTTGLIEVPTARLLRPNSVSVGACWYNEADTTTMFADVGLAPDVEANVVRVKVKDGPDKTVLGAKLLLFKGLPPVTAVPTSPVPTPEQVLRRAAESKARQVIERLLKPAVAVGVRNVNDKRLPGMAGAQFYVVASARIPLVKLNAHYGFLKDRRKLGVIMGADMRLGRYTLMAEYERDHVNAGARIKVGRGTSALVAVRDVDGRRDLLLAVNWKLSL